MKSREFFRREGGRGIGYPRARVTKRVAFECNENDPLNSSKTAFRAGLRRRVHCKEDQ